MVYFYDNSSISQFPFSEAMLGRCLGPAKNEGNEMTQWILKQNGGMVPRRTVRKLTSEILAPSNEIEKAKRDAFDINIKRKLDDSFSPPVNALQPDNSKEHPTYDYYGEDPFLEDEEFKTSKISVADYVDANAKPILVHSLTDILVSAEVEGF